MVNAQIPADVFRFAAILSAGEEYSFPTHDGKICVVSRKKNDSGEDTYAFAWQDA